MKVYSISIDEFSDDNYKLIGIQTTLKDYKLAFLLNKHLRIILKRCKKDLVFKVKNHEFTFSLFAYTNLKLDNQWYLVSNVFVSKLDGLFENIDIENYLISEKKRVNYFIKLEGYFTDNFIEKTINSINQIPQVTSSYSIEPSTLQSKEFLIF